MIYLKSMGEHHNCGQYRLVFTLFELSQLL